PETALSGVSWLGDGGLFYDQCHRYLVKKADHWVFAETNLKNGETFGSAATGPETDRVQTDGPNGLKSPSDYTLASIYDLTFPSLEVGTMGTFKPGDKSGEVFNAATLNWASGLHLEEKAMDVIDRITLNVITRLGPSHLFP